MVGTHYHIISPCSHTKSDEGKREAARVLIELGGMVDLKSYSCAAESYSLIYLSVTDSKYKGILHYFFS